MLNDRRKTVLRALVREYVRSAHPVGSKSLVDHYDLDCSPATVRNDLAALEDLGHVFQPHVSAGRVPTDVGYRAFVDDIAGLQENASPSSGEVEAVRSRLREVESELTGLMQEAGQLLTTLTNYAAVVLAPTLQRSRVRRVDLVPLSDARVLVVLITDTGQVAKRSVELGESVEDDELRTLEEALNRALDGRLAEELEEAAEELAGSSPRASVVLAVLDELFGMLTDAAETAVYHGGTAALLHEPEFEDPQMVRTLMGLFEDGLLLAETFSEAGRSRGVRVRIGGENSLQELGQMSVVLAPYGVGGAGGFVGLLGPTRMDYLRAIRGVRCVADTLTDAMAPGQD